MNESFGDGAGPSKIGPAPSSSLVAFPFEVYETDILDLTKPALGIELVPARPGHFPMLGTARFLVVQLSGVQTSPGTNRAGSDAGRVNFMNSSATPTNASVNACSPPCVLLAGGIAPNNLERIPGAPVFFDVTAGAQGGPGFVLLARLVALVYWASVGG